MNCVRRPLRRWLTTGMGLAFAVATQPVLTEPPSDAGLEPPAVPAASAGPDQSPLAARLGDIERLLVQIESLETQLDDQARRAHARADAARSHDERVREERLHGEIGARIEALRATRDELARQIQTLQDRLNDPNISAPER